MPMYEYQCAQCGRRTEKRQKFSDAPLTECPYCGGALKKLISAPAVQFKGGGWYADGYGSAKSTASSTGEGGTASAKSDSGDTKAASTASDDSGSTKSGASSDSSSASTASTAASSASSSSTATDK